MEIAMRSNGRGEAPAGRAVRTADALSYVTWQTETDIVLPIGAVQASGDASVQVRSPQRLAELGDSDAQVAHVRRVIVEALTTALTGMEPTVDALQTQRDEIASLTLVSANRKLSAAGVSLLDLQINIALSPLPAA
jgi:hypothetical protein